MSTTNKNYSEAMAKLEEADPSSYKAVQRKVRALKAEAMNWRLKAQGKTSSVIESKEAFDGRQVEHQ